MLEDFSEAMSLREHADYGLVYSEDSARIAIEYAENFLGESSKLVVLSPKVKKLAPRRRKFQKTLRL